MAAPRKRRTGAHCPVEAYARDVLARRLIAGRLVQLACQRHLDDLARGSRRGLIWDPAAARHALTFFTHLRHSTGEWANASNVAVRQDPAGNIKPDKERSRERIDGISALINALGRALLRDNNRYIYQGRTMVVLE